MRDKKRVMKTVIKIKRENGGDRQRQIEEEI